MIEIKTIAVAIDFSEASSIIIKWAKWIAKKLEAKVILINIIENIPTSEETANGRTFEELEKNLFESAEKYMQNFLNKYFSDFPDVKPIISKGEIVKKIIEIATENKADLIIIGTHGKKGIDKILFGSVADGVVKYSPIPVLTINPYKMRERKS